MVEVSYLYIRNKEAMKSVRIINLRTNEAETVRFATVETAKVFFQLMISQLDLGKFKIEYTEQSGVIRCSGITMY